MTDLIRVSPSQIKTIRRCERLWAFDKIDRMPRKTSPAQQIGIDNHKDIEGWLKENKLPGPIAKQAIRPGFLPNPSPNLLIEQGFDRPMPEVADNVLMIGFIDVVIPDWTLPIICDHKTTSSLGYAFKEAPRLEKTLPPVNVGELAFDEQAVVYAKVVQETVKSPAVGVRWLYYEYKKATMLPSGMRKVEATLTKDHLDAQWNDIIVPAVKRIVYHKLHTKRALDAEPNPRECSAFGGCPYLSICPVTPAQALAAHQTQFEKFGQPAHLLLTSSPTPAINAPVDPVTAPERRSKSMNFAKFGGTPPSAPLTNGATHPAVMGVAPVILPLPVVAMPTIAPTSAPAAGFISRLKEMQEKSGAVGVNPPEAALPPAALVAPVAVVAPVVSMPAPSLLQQMMASAGPAPAAPVVGHAVVQQAAPPSEAMLIVPATVAEPAPAVKRGRPPKAPKAAAEKIDYTPSPVDLGEGSEYRGSDMQCVAVIAAHLSAYPGSAETIASRAFDIFAALKEEAARRDQIPF